MDLLSFNLPFALHFHLLHTHPGLLLDRWHPYETDSRYSFKAPARNVTRLDTSPVPSDAGSSPPASPGTLPFPLGSQQARSCCNITHVQSQPQHLASSLPLQPSDRFVPGRSLSRDDLPTVTACLAIPTTGAENDARRRATLTAS